MIALPHDFSYSPRRSAGAVARYAGLSLLATLEGWAERRRQRRALLELSDHALKDIGLNRSDAFEEGSKPFWRA
jgi:uncharacterized protein YjiS (DUF1127 family)